MAPGRCRTRPEGFLAKSHQGVGGREAIQADVFGHLSGRVSLDGRPDRGELGSGG